MDGGSVQLATTSLKFHLKTDADFSAACLVGQSLLLYCLLIMTCNYYIATYNMPLMSLLLHSISFFFSNEFQAHVHVLAIIYICLILVLRTQQNVFPGRDKLLNNSIAIYRYHSRNFAKTQQHLLYNKFMCILYILIYKNICGFL